ncbi:hypothetical protein [Meiothermus granaticius]|uniref:Uncharacterized protein n=1 Tax=Meiothermus granaticius NBRC 107808 TaxID=1227551 RepID=A0A399FDJ7_9DEIN|nr:hypothetical protein [Meiothermus granaticius]MCL6526476.1 hypothetical protein [Thermaceae bacterium]RIH92901.1 hypothetical protein Mgrana_01176 [Meiothermus granaticius NBRC 107808]GEM86757.1 hypothetical protein MGR01S_13820 [Meiothermus granaticius NBRC 107808]
MLWEHIDEYADFHLGDAVIWLTEDRTEDGVITEIAVSPEGPVFWLSCAPFWVRPEEVRHNTDFFSRGLAKV